MAKLDAEYIARREDVLGLYEKPLSERAPVVCIDEKPVVLHADTRPAAAMRPGRVARRDYEYKRCGTANVFCGVEPKAGRHFTKATPTRCSAEFADYLLKIAVRYPAADTIHLVMDNLSTRTRKAVVDRFGEQNGDWLWNRFTVHYTPKHGSWLNQAEVAISLFSRQCLGSATSPPCASRLAPGTAASTAPRPKSSGSLPAAWLDASFTTHSRGLGTRTWQRIYKDLKAREKAGGRKITRILPVQPRAEAQADR
ncbi:MAG TPA: IS630 family transposase [Terriglobales bacterium]|nr:IS630 family transposase [Terriglobales bacterium]